MRKLMINLKVIGISTYFLSSADYQVVLTQTTFEFEISLKGSFKEDGKWGLPAYKSNKNYFELFINDDARMWDEEFTYLR